MTSKNLNAKSTFMQIL